MYIVECVLDGPTAVWMTEEVVAAVDADLADDDMTGSNPETKAASLRDRVERARESFNESPQSIGLRFRLDLSRLVCDALDAKSWTQRDLAREAGMKESFVSRIINADSNCTFDVAGRLLFALGIRPGEVGIRPEDSGRGP